MRSSKYVSKVIVKCIGQTGDIVNIYKKIVIFLYKGLTELGYECFKPEGAFICL